MGGVNAHAGERGVSGEGLTPTQSALVLLSGAIAGGGAEDGGGRARSRVAAGLSPERLYEAVLQSYLFVGFPRAIEAFFAVHPLLEDCRHRPIVPPEDLAVWRKEGETLCRRVYGKNYEKLLA